MATTSTQRTKAVSDTQELADLLAALRDNTDPNALPQQSKDSLNDIIGDLDDIKDTLTNLPLS